MIQRTEARAEGLFASFMHDINALYDAVLPVLQPCQPTDTREPMIQVQCIGMVNAVWPTKACTEGVIAFSVHGFVLHYCAEQRPCGNGVHSANTRTQDALQHSDDGNCYAPVPLLTCAHVYMRTTHTLTHAQ